MADRTDVLLQQWLSRWEQIRHSETQRATVTNMLLVLAAAGLGFISQKGLRPQMMVVSGSLILTGLVGLLASLKYYERFKLHLREAGALRRKLDEIHPELGITDLVDRAYSEQQREFPRLSRMPLYALWIVLHLGIMCAGVIVTLIILLRL